MPKGTSHVLKCPRCKRGMWREPRAERGVEIFGVERTVSRSKHGGSGSGGSRFRGHRGRVRCLDCGHVWLSTHPRSGRIRCEGAECHHEVDLINSM